MSERREGRRVRMERERERGEGRRGPMRERGERRRDGSEHNETDRYDAVFTDTAYRL